MRLMIARTAAAGVFILYSTAAFAQSTGGPFSGGAGFLILGVVLFATCAVAAYYAYYRLYVARTNRYGVEEFNGAGDYMRQGVKRFATGALLAIWMLAAIAMIFIGLAH